MKFSIEEASNRWGKAKEVRIYTLKGLKRFVEKEFKGRKDMYDEAQEIIISFKRKRIIIYDDYVE